MVQSGGNLFFSWKLCLPCKCFEKCVCWEQSWYFLWPYWWNREGNASSCILKHFDCSKCRSVWKLGTSPCSASLTLLEYSQTLTSWLGTFGVYSKALQGGRLFFKCMLTAGIVKGCYWNVLIIDSYSIPGVPGYRAYRDTGIEVRMLRYIRYPYRLPYARYFSYLT